MEELQPKRVFSYLFILVIAVVFTLSFGPGSKGCEVNPSAIATESAATVNGKEVPLRDFNREYSAQLSYFRSQGSPFPEEIARQIGIPKQVLDRLVNTELLAQAAERMGVKASDAELLEVLKKNPEFQKNGHFDYEQYKQMVQDYERKTLTEFETNLRRRLAANKVLEMVESAASVSDEEVKAKFFREGNKAQATYVRFMPSQYATKVPAATAADLAAFKKDHAKELADYYEANKIQYHQSEKVHARHILVKADKSAPPEQQAAAKAKIEQIRKDIEGGKDFIAVAKEVSEDVGSKESGGDLGFQESSAWVKEFSDAAFSLKPGEMSQPVQSQFGFHLIKVEEKRPPTKKELKEVEDEIARVLIAKDRAKQLAKADAEKALTAIKAGKKLTELFPPAKEDTAERFAPEAAPSAVETGEFDSTEIGVPKLGPAPELAQAIFAQEGPKLLEKPFLVGEAWVVAEVTARTKPTDDAFSKQKEQLRTEATKAKQYELREAYLKALRNQAQVTTNEAVLTGKDLSS